LDSNRNGNSIDSFNQSEISKIYNINLPEPSKKKTRNMAAVRYNSDMGPNNATIEEDLIDDSLFNIQLG
jgi:hypothetical protein